MEELNSVRAKELDPKVRMHILTKKVLYTFFPAPWLQFSPNREYDQHSTVARHLHRKTNYLFRSLLLLPCSFLIIWVDFSPSLFFTNKKFQHLFHPHGAVSYTHTAAGVPGGWRYLLEEMSFNMRWRYRTEIYNGSIQRITLNDFQKIPAEEKKYKFFTWT